MKRTVSVLLVALLMAGLLAGCGGGGKEAGKAPAAGETVEIKIACVGNEDHQSTIMAKYFKEELEKLYDGDLGLKIDIYPNAALGGKLLKG